MDVGGEHVALPLRNGLSEAISLGLARRLDLEVLSSRSLLDRVDFAEQQQLAGCDSSTCMAEVANAMGARFVVFSRIVRLGDEEILRSDIYDNVAGLNLALASVSARNADELNRQVPALVEALIRESRGLLALRAVDRPIAVADSRPTSPASNLIIVGGVGTAIFGGTIVWSALTSRWIDEASATYAKSPTADNASAVINARGPFDINDGTVVLARVVAFMPALVSLAVGIGGFWLAVAPEDA